MAERDLREMVRQIYDFAQANLYFNRPDLPVNGERYNSALLLSLLTALVGGKALITGEPGLGKTTAAEYVGALLYRLPVGVLWASEVAGHPEQTEEKIVARPDLGKLNLGEEEVIWSYFAQVPVKIVDEINRLPETKQGMILDGVDRGNWEYMNRMIVNADYCLFATANYQDRGTNTIIAPLLDRFDVSVESRHPGPNYAYLVGQRQDKEQLLRHPRLEQEFREVLGSRLDPEAKAEKLLELSRSYGNHLRQTLQVDTLDGKQRRLARRQIESLPFDQDANGFLRLLVAEMSFCDRRGQKRSNETCDEGCHYSGYLCHRLRSCASNRLPGSVSRYARALAWLHGADQVGVETLRSIAPYCLAHRLQWTEAHVSLHQDDRRQDPLHLHLARLAVEEVYQRYCEQADQIKEALAIAFRIFNGEMDLSLPRGDHPLYVEIRKDLLLEEQ